MKVNEYALTPIEARNLRHIIYGAWTQEFMNITRQISNPLLLDFGCGDATRLFHLLEDYKHLSAVGIDISLEPLRRAVKSANERGIKDRVDFIQGDTHFIPIKNSIFGCSLVINILYLLPSLASIAELRRVVEKGGVVLVIEKTFNPMIARALYSIINNRLMSRVLSKLGLKDWASSFIGNYYLTLRLLKETLLQAGFKILREDLVFNFPLPEKPFIIFPQKRIKLLIYLSNCIEDCIRNIPIINKLSLERALLCIGAESDYKN